MAVVNSVQNIPKIREEGEQFKNFVKEQFIKRNKLITNPLKKNKQKKILSKDKARGLCAFLKVIHGLSKSRL